MIAYYKMMKAAFWQLFFMLLFILKSLLVKF